MVEPLTGALLVVGAIFAIIAVVKIVKKIVKIGIVLAIVGGMIYLLQNGIPNSLPI